MLPSAALLGLAKGSWNQVLWGSAHFLQPGCMEVSVTAASMMAVMVCEVCVLRFLQGMWLSSQHSLPVGEALMEQTLAIGSFSCPGSPCFAVGCGHLALHAGHGHGWWLREAVRM